MLEYAEHVFAFPSQATNAAQSELVSYAGKLVSAGYIARKHHVLHVAADRLSIIVGGVTCASDALAAAQANAHVAASLERVRTEEGGRDTIRCSWAAGTDDEAYGPTGPWAQLQLCCDPILGLSPIRTLEWGIVAVFQLPLDTKLQEDLWAWDIEYDSVYACYLAGGAYERWAHDELSDLTSALNTAGRDLASRVAGVAGCPVDYFQHKGS